MQQSLRNLSVDTIVRTDIARTLLQDVESSLSLPSSLPLLLIDFIKRKRKKKKKKQLDAFTFECNFRVLKAIDARAFRIDEGRGLRTTRAIYLDKRLFFFMAIQDHKARGERASIPRRGNNLAKSAKTPSPSHARLVASQFRSTTNN